MYGIIHDCIKCLILVKYGKEIWNSILTDAACDNEAFLLFKNYEDEVTTRLLLSMAQKLGVSFDEVLYDIGAYFVEYAINSGHGKMLQSLGHNLRVWIENVDSLHWYLMTVAYQNIRSPSFQVEAGENNDTLILHYYSTRDGLHPLAEGLIRQAAQTLFNTHTNFTFLKKLEEVHANGSTRWHVIFKIQQVNMNKSYLSLQSFNSIKSNNNYIKIINTNMEDFMINVHILSELFPYHVIFDETLHLHQCGSILAKMFPQILSKNITVDNLFSMSHPNVPFTYTNILKHKHMLFMFEVSEKSQDGKSSLTLKGQMIFLQDKSLVLFACSPLFCDLNDLAFKNLSLSNIPIHDNVRELMLLKHQRVAEFELIKELEKMTAELKKTANALDAEKKKTDDLLHAMLPKTVADQLREGKKVEAAEYPDVTLLFSDIVTFTKIAAACNPIEVVNMLNELYLGFDKLTSQHGVYKVETIGDAYMVVGGVPEYTPNHAKRVASMAIDMVNVSNSVLSPVTLKPLQIRVGIHTGPVVAGVVGEKMPRFCLFGDTVNTASRMESHSLPGKIHCSDSTYKALQNDKYIFEERGEIQVKGKGTMTTYFLIALNHNINIQSAACEEEKFKARDFKNNSKSENSSEKKKIIKSCICIIF